MQKSTFIAFFFAAIALRMSVANAESISDRITVIVRGKGPDVVLIPGLTCSGSVWDATAAHVEDYHRLHIVQIDGFAGSPARANAQGPILQPVVDALDTYIRTNHLKSPKIIGHSLGGTIGLMLAIQHPEDVGGLMVVDALPFTGLLLGKDDVASAEPIAAEWRDQTLKESQEEYARGERKFIRILVKTLKERETVARWAIASNKSVVAQATYEDMTTDLRPRLSQIKVPVTVLYAWDADNGYSKDMTDALYRQNYAALPNKTLVRIDNSYHFIMFDQPEAFLTQVDLFLQ